VYDLDMNIFGWLFISEPWDERENPFAVNTSVVKQL